MSEKKKGNRTPVAEEAEEKNNNLSPEPEAEAEAPVEPHMEPMVEEEPGASSLREEVEQLRLGISQWEDKFLRLAAEYDNYRKRTAKEKESAWQNAKAETATAFFPVYDNLERALKQETADEAYKKGVEMTMGQLQKVLEELGIAAIPALGQTFDPNLHNAVMHVEDDSLEEGIVVEVFQTGFMMGEKVIRFSVVKVAN